MNQEASAGVRTEADVAYLWTFLPPGWARNAKELGALRRCRKFHDAQVLLRIFLIHLAEGCSLRETAVRARQGGLASVSDVAIMDRLRQAEEWVRWMHSEVLAHWVVRQPRAVFGERWNLRVVDGTDVTEPGPTGSSWRIHYAIGLPSLRCAAVEVTGSRGPGRRRPAWDAPCGPGGRRCPRACRLEQLAPLEWALTCAV